MKQIKVWPGHYSRNAFYALVDDADFDFLNKFHWSIIKRNGGFHALTTIEDKMVYMHQLVLPSPDAALTPDHINGNGLDNQRCNLRLATRQQQQANRNLQSNNTSTFKGVSWNKRRNKWRAFIGFSGTQIHLGYFISKEVAAKAYNAKAIELFGEFAKLNILD